MAYMKRLDPFLQTMEQYGKVINVFVNISSVVAFIWVCIISSITFTSNANESKRAT